MAKNPSKGNARKNPTGSHPNNEPEKPFHQFLRFVLSWPFLGAAAVVFGGGIWNYVSPTPAAPWIIATGIGGLIFAVFHKLFNESGPIVRYLLPIVIWGGIFLSTWLIQRTDTGATDVTQAVNRAWLLVENIAPEGPFDDKKDTVIRIRIKNSGRVPATFTGFAQINYTTTFPLNDDEMFLGIAPSKKEMSKGVLGSGDVCDLRIPTENSRFALRASGLPVYMYVMGAINYEDVFGKHTTKFCAYRKDGDDPKTLTIAPNNNWAK